MTLISSSIPNFVNGVSQQPYTLRLASQLEGQINGLSTVSRGLKKRPPTQHIARIIDTPLSSAYLHTINRDGTEKYILVITNGSLRVFDTTGDEMTVNPIDPDALAYISGFTGSAASVFTATTVADYTFVVNKRVVVTQSTGLTDDSPHPNWALLNVKLGNYGKTYRIYIGGTMVATHTTPDGGAASHSAQISTDYIAEQLEASFNLFKAVSSPTYDNYVIGRNGSILYIRNNFDAFSVTVEDGFNGNAMVAINKRVRAFTDLPASPYRNELKVEVAGDPGNTFDNYWVMYDGVAAEGKWVETVAPNISIGFTDRTMPHVLVRESNGTFTFRAGDWSNRIVGDLESNPNPSFVGRTINDVFFFRNRLGLLSDENVILSEAGEPFNFFRTTITTLLDSDPIDVAVSNNRVSILKHAVPFEKKLFIYSDQTQFVIDQTEILTPKTVAIDVSTEYPCSPAVKPVASGSSIYYVSERGRWSAVREQYVDNSTGTNESVDVTAHVPEYIRSGVFKVAAAPNEDILLFISTNERNTVWVYKYFAANGEKLQSSWSKWVFPTTDTILHVEFLGSEAYFVISRSSGVFLEKLNVAAQEAIYPEPYLVLLDRKVIVLTAHLTYSEGYTTIGSLPYTPNDGTYYLVARANNGVHTAKILPVEWTGSVARVLGNITGFGGSFTFGRSYTSTFRLSPITIKEPLPGGGQKSDTEGRLQIRKIGLNFADTGYFKVQVTPEGRDTFTYSYTGKRLGSTAVVGETGLATDRLTVPVVSRNTTTTIELINDLPIPCSFLSADWEGFYVKRSKQV